MIDTSTWKSFECSKLFECKNTGNILARDVEDGSGTTPFVTASAYNNGVVGYIDASDYEIIKGHCILVGGKTFTITYQEEDFVSNDSHNFVIRLKDNKISKMSYLYLASVIYNYFGQKFSWSDAVTKDKLLSDKLPLPATSKGDPDWKYMASYMTGIMAECEKNLAILKSADIHKKVISTAKWKKFHLYDGIFDIDMGTKLDKTKMHEKNPSVNFVGRANTNNGITTCVDEIEGLEPYKAGYMTLSLGGEYLGSCFVQPKPFYTSQNVVVLIPKFDMSDNVKRFLGTVIFKESRIHYKAFVDELNRHIKTDFEICLPVTAKGEPDWQYMDDYMTRIMNETEASYAQLSVI